MNYIYERMLQESDVNDLNKTDSSNQVEFDKEQMAKFEEYVTQNYEDFYANKVSYEVLRQGEKFLITLFENSFISLEDILRDIEE
jgi:hypothetical protein